jgi:hypothetical protein
MFVYGCWQDDQRSGTEYLGETQTSRESKKVFEDWKKEKKFPKSFTVWYEDKEEDGYI